VSGVLRALIAEDEEPARLLLRSMLRQEPGVEIVAEAADGWEAVAGIQAHRPDVVFLDVQLPELDGFGVIDTIGIARMPPVIFVTAYDRYALRAFDVCALDYLLKPFDAERLHRAVARASEDGTSRSSAGGERLTALLETLEARRGYAKRLPVKVDGDRVVLLPTAEVQWLEADDKCVRVHTGKDTHLFRGTITQLERALDPDRFLRVHRSIVVNLDTVKEIQPWSQGVHLIILKDGTELRTGRAYQPAVRKLIGGGRKIP
jgi:two-component system LytT family response regulator